MSSITTVPAPKGCEQCRYESKFDLCSPPPLHSVPILAPRHGLKYIFTYMTAFALMLVLGLFLLLFLLRPSDHGGPRQSPFDFFAAWHAREMASKNENANPLGDGFAVINVEAMEHNAALLRSSIGPAEAAADTGATAKPATALRLVCKSLPSLDVLRYAMTLTRTERLMVFHLSFLGDILSQFVPESSATAAAAASANPPEFAELDVLLGVPLTAAAARRFLISARSAGLQDGRWKAIQERRVRWLVDSPQRAAEYAAVAAAFNVTLRVTVEIDVGLHRGGALNPATALLILRSIADSTGGLEFGGYMGYDGHCQGSPLAAFLGQEVAMELCIRDVIVAYAAFIAHGRASFPSMFDSRLVDSGVVVFNGAGSSTIMKYKGLDEGRVLTDLSAGSALLKPGDFDLPTLEPFKPALYIGGVVIKALSTERNPVPFMPNSVWRLLRWWDPNLRHAVYVEGSSMPTCPTVDPPGMQPNPIFALGLPAGLNVFPTQALLQHGDATKLTIGDVVFNRPNEADAMLGYGVVYGLDPRLPLQQSPRVFETYHYGI